MSLYEKDLIVALATPRGIGALSVIRVSGHSLSSLFFKLTNINKIKFRYAYYGKILSSSGVVLDNSVIIFYKGPFSFTGEDVVEISCHGGEVVSKKIIDQIIAYGARYANPGEFSKRAFLNGKIDLIEAESINNIIHSRSYLEAKNGLMNLQGKTQTCLISVKKSLLNLLTIVEHELDFVEEEIGFLSIKKIKKILDQSILSIKQIIAGSLVGKKIQTGFKVVLVGAPNAGKSSLFNSILGYNRAIVSSVRGTTRDTVEAFVEVGGYPVVFADTAGHYRTKNELDAKGVKKTEEAINEADIILVVDEKSPSTFIKSFNFQNKPLIEIVSKVDLNKNKKNKKGTLYVSSLKNKNIDKLLTALSTLIKNTFFNNEPFFAPERQLVLLKGAHTALSLVSKNLSQQDMVAFSSVLRQALDALKEVFGEIYNDEILDNIFKGFCVGK